MRPRYVFEIARFTLLEALSRRLILAGVAISLLYIGLFALGFHFAHVQIVAESSGRDLLSGEAGLILAVLTLFGIYVVNYLSSFLALFLSVGAVSSEIDSGTLHAVLARPLARTEFILGRWLGYATLLTVYVLGMVALVMLVARLITGYQVPNTTPALLLILLECLLLLSVSLLGSTLLPTLANGVVAFTLLGVAWLGGILEFIGRLLAQDENPAAGDALLNIGTVVSLVLPSDALWRGASYYLQPPILLAAMSATRDAVPFFSPNPPATALIIWSLGYVVVLMAAAMFSFSRRDL
jgi:Cu-processing system permease protein